MGGENIGENTLKDVATLSITTPEYRYAECRYAGCRAGASKKEGIKGGKKIEF